MIYVYALTDPLERSLPACQGLQNQPLQAHQTGRIAAVYSELTDDPIRPTRENLWCHETVIETIMQRHPVLPVRFNTTFADIEALQTVLATHTQTLAQGLQSVRDRVELGLRVLWTPPHQSSVSDTAGEQATAQHRSGYSYMMHRLEKEKQHQALETDANDLAEAIHQSLAADAQDATRRILATPKMLLSAAYLLPNDQIASFKQQVHTLASNHPELRMLCTGPWPPYHFVPAFQSEPLSHG